MFDQLFSCCKTVSAYLEAPLLDERLRYIQHLASQGAKRGTLRKVASHQLLLIEFLGLCAGATVRFAQIEAAAKAWRISVEHRANCSCKNDPTQRFTGNAVGFLRFLGWLEETHEPLHAHCEKVAEYSRYMRQERGWAKDTVNFNVSVINRFFKWLQGCGIEFRDISIQDVDNYLSGFQATGKYSRETVRDYGQGVRTFFRYAQQRNWCSPNISEGILTPGFLPEQRIPKGIRRDQVLELLTTVSGTRPWDLRARAVLMLLITYGLRAGEICALRLQDLDWHQEKITVRRPKPGRIHSYPLSTSVGSAIADYLRWVRPNSESQSLFLTLNAPIRPLTGSAVYHIVAGRMEKIGVTNQRKGPHALRHAAAQHLLDQGMPMKTISDYLGHRSIDITAVYSKMDLKSLRTVADLDLGLDMEGLL